jgi:hypothetical protein
MRLAAFALVGAIGVAFAAASANAAPILPNPAGQGLSNIVLAAGGCGRGLHPNRWGRCVSNRYYYARPRPYWRSPYAGYHWRSPSDRVANQLNAQELGRVYSGGGSPYYRGY